MDIRFRWLQEASGSVYPFELFVKLYFNSQDGYRLSRTKKTKKVPAKVPARTLLTGLKLVRKDMAGYVLTINVTRL